MQKNVFLSRASAEFHAITAQLCADSSKYDWLRLYDQANPPEAPRTESSALTIEKLLSWISRCDHVFHYVGAVPGSALKVPGNELRDLADCVDARCRRPLESLQERLGRPANGARRPLEVTYTMAEAVIAIGLGKDLVVFWLNERDVAIRDVSTCDEQGQQAYRDWLYEYYLRGRDRIPLDFREDALAASHRQLQRLNEAAALQQMARSTVALSLQDAIWRASSEQALDTNTTSFWEEFRDSAQPTDLEWIVCKSDLDQSARAWHDPAPEPIYKVLPAPGRLNTERWLIPYDNHFTRLEISEDGPSWRHWLGIRGKDVRALCVSDADVWILREFESRYYLHRLEPDGTDTATLVDGFSTHGFSPIRLWSVGPHFYLASAGHVWCLERDAANNRRIARLIDSESGDSIGTPAPGVAEQVSIAHTFSVRRYFRGRTYDSGATGDRRWALVNEQGVLLHLTIRSGSFLDAFKTLDVTFEENWECDVPVSLDGVVFLHVFDAARATKSQLPLFPHRGEQVSWMLAQTHIPLIKLGVKLGGAALVDELRPVGQRRFSSHCFVSRHYDDVNDTTRLRVWLLPARLTPEILTPLRNMVCGLEPLPATPIHEVAQITRKFDARRIDDDWASWWATLWRSCYG